MVNPNGRGPDDPCGDVHEEPADYRHLCQLPRGHAGPHECWSGDATWPRDIDAELDNYAIDRAARALGLGKQNA